MNMGYKLCYIAGDVAYFTSGKVEDEWGDDWNDAPYEHNAGTPYGKSGEIRTLRFTANGLDQPCDLRSDFSVQYINLGGSPWLQSNEDADFRGLRVWAGASPYEFIMVVERSGGIIWIPRGDVDPTADWE